MGSSKRINTKYSIQFLIYLEFVKNKVKEVRTNDDTLLTVKLMVIYELIDVNLMVINFIHFLFILLHF
jgi:hypothetical protein